MIARGLGTVCHRELLAQSRTGAAWRWRIWTALCLVGVLGFEWLRSPAGATGAGLILFRGLVTWLGLMALVLPPLFVADSLAREVREETLPLLRLTPLTTSGIVLGKAMQGWLRAMGIVVGAVPMLAVPVLVGGVKPEHLVAGGIGVLGLTVLGLGAGLWGSAGAVQPGRALWRSYGALLGAVVVLGVLQGVGGMLELLMAPWRLFSLLSHGWQELCLVPSNDSPWYWARRFGAAAGRGAIGWEVVVPAVRLLLASLVMAALLVLMGGRRLRRVEAEMAAGQRRGARGGKAGWVWRVPAPFQARYRRWRLGLLEANPLEWLFRRTPARALTRWFWLGLAGFFWATQAQSLGWMTGWGDGLAGTPLPWLLAAVMVWVASSVFRQERATGTLELLLVTGIRERQVIASYVRTFRQTYLPVTILSAVVASYLEGLGYEGRDRIPLLWSPVAAAWALPGIGLACAFRWRGMFKPFLGTLLLSWGVPWLLAGLWWMGPWGPRLIGVGRGDGENAGFYVLADWIAAGWMLLAGWFMARSGERRVSRREFGGEADGNRD